VGIPFSPGVVGEPLAGVEDALVVRAVQHAADHRYAHGPRGLEQPPSAYSVSRWWERGRRRFVRLNYGFGGHGAVRVLQTLGCFLAHEQVAWGHPMRWFPPSIQVLAEIKADPDLHTIPVVILTVSRDEQDVLLGQQLAASAYITKPVDLPQFIDVIESIEGFCLTIASFPREFQPAT
jgi:hypothetical protein